MCSGRRCADFMSLFSKTTAPLWLALGAPDTKVMSSLETIPFPESSEKPRKTKRSQFLTSVLYFWRDTHSSPSWPSNLLPQFFYRTDRRAECHSYFTALDGHWDFQRTILCYFLSVCIAWPVKCSNYGKERVSQIPKSPGNSVPCAHHWVHVTGFCTDQQFTWTAPIRCQSSRQSGKNKCWYY